MTVDEFKKMSKDVPIVKRPQKWWDLLSILGGIASAILWLLYSGIREGFDFLTPLLMIAIPVFMIWFREDLDVVLLGVQPYRKDVNKVLLVGIGMAFPFLTAFILFNLGIRNYPLIQWNMLIGTFGAYIITRNPVISMPGMGAQPGAGQRPVPATHGILLLLAAAIGSFLIIPVRADDCTRDILNAQDCLRTGGYAEGISGGFSTILSTSVNGPTVIQTLSGGGTQAPQTPVQPTQPAQPSTPPAPATPADQAGSAGPSTGQPQTPADQAGTAGQTAGPSPDGQPVTPTDQTGTAGQTAGPSPDGQPVTPTDQTGTAGQTTGQPATSGPSTQPATPADQAGSAGTSAGSSQTTTPATQPSAPADQAGTAGQTSGQTTTSTPATPPAQTTTPAGADGLPPGNDVPAGTLAQGPDSLPVNPDDVQNIKETIDDMRNERTIAAAAAAATAATGAGAAAAAATTVQPPTPPGIDPNTGRRILTPEQQQRREAILAEMEKNSQEAESWSSYGDWLGYGETAASVITKSADIALDVGSVLAPGAGGTVKSVYSAVKTVATSTTESILDGKGAWAGLVKGSGEALVDKALDFVGGKVTDWFGGKIPLFGKFEGPPGADLGDVSVSEIWNRLRGTVVKPDTGDAIQNLRQLAVQGINTGEAREALANGAKNALQGQAQSYVIWDRVKSWTGWFG
jgi:hypothetical protein